MNVLSPQRLALRTLALLALSLAVAAVPAAPQPAQPAKPSRPAKPQNPTKPGKPVLPAKPGRPGNPSKPGKPAKPSRKPHPAKPLPNPVKPPQPVAAATISQAPVVSRDLSPEQHAMASRVLVGQVDCEFGQTVELAPLPQPGHFQLRIGQARYTLVPQETTTGAVRLEDADRGIVWLQIPTKSMLLDAARGQRLVDNCQHAAQREAQRATGIVAGRSLGIADVPPLSDPWSGVAPFAPQPDLAFEPLPAWAGTGCCEPGTASLVAGGCVVGIVQRLLQGGSADQQAPVALPADAPGDCEPPL